MSCCGSQRQSLQRPPVRAPGPNVEASSLAASPQQAAVWFIYTGPAAITVIGGATGRHYRFAQTGARVPVDSRDALTVRRIATLRRA
jgi:hypothetical protein